jgi:hypothetical protein
MEVEHNSLSLFPFVFVFCLLTIVNSFLAFSRLAAAVLDILRVEHRIRERVKKGCQIISQCIMADKCRDDYYYPRMCQLANQPLYPVWRAMRGYIKGPRPHPAPISKCGMYLRETRQVDLSRCAKLSSDIFWGLVNQLTKPNGAKQQLDRHGVYYNMPKISENGDAEELTSSNQLTHTHALTIYLLGTPKKVNVKNSKTSRIRRKWMKGNRSQSAKLMRNLKGEREKEILI